VSSKVHPAGGGQPAAHPAYGPG